MRVTKITIGRLYNLGSYEHVRYELSLEVGDGESAALALQGIERIMAALNPKRPGNVPSEIETAHEHRRMDAMNELSDEQFERMHGGYVGTRAEYMERIRHSTEEGEKRREVWKERSRKARELLDDLGGAAVWKDAKLEWDDADYGDEGE